MSSIEEIASAILELPQRNRAGTLRMFGDWFGRPLDNVHFVVDAVAEEGRLVLRFAKHETLTVWNPDGYETEGHTLRIAHADRVRWEWNSVGKEPSENQMFRDYILKQGKIVVSCSHGSSDRDVSLNHPAVEVIGL